MTTYINTGTILVDTAQRGVPLTFWQITSKAHKNVKLREIPATLWETGKNGKPNLYVPDIPSAPNRPSAQGYNLEECVSIRTGLPHYATPWDGRPVAITPKANN